MGHNLFQEFKRKDFVFDVVFPKIADYIVWERLTRRLGINSVLDVLFFGGLNESNPLELVELFYSEETPDKVSGAAVVRVGGTPFEEHLLEVPLFFLEG